MHHGPLKGRDGAPWKKKIERKKENENKKNQKVTETKEIRLRPNIDVHDIDVKI